ISPRCISEASNSFPHRFGESRRQKTGETEVCFQGKADAFSCSPTCPLMTQSGQHTSNFRQTLNPQHTPLLADVQLNGRLVVWTARKPWTRHPPGSMRSRKPWRAWRQQGTSDPIVTAEIMIVPPAVL